MPSGTLSDERTDEALSDLAGGGGKPAALPVVRSVPASATGGAAAGPSGSGELSAGELMGDPPAPQSTGGESAGADNQEVGSDGTESAVESAEYADATPEQLQAAAQESGMESAFGDLSGAGSDDAGEFSIDPETSMGEAALPDVGNMEGGGEEFFGALAALVPTLISTVGPTVVKAIAGRLKPKVKSRLGRIGAMVRPVAAAVAGKPAQNPSQNKDAILALIAQLLGKSESMPVNETSVAAAGLSGEALEIIVANAVATIEAIVDRDDRVRIRTTTNIPFRRLCALTITFPGGLGKGTGFLIGPRTLATAGHCVYSHDHGGWARSIEVSPGADGTSKPYGSVTSTSFRSVAAWTKDRSAASDYGCIVLPGGAFNGRNLGAFGYAVLSPAQLLAQRAVIAGYPGDKPFAELWGAGRLLAGVTPTTLRYNTATYAGQSGAPVYVIRNGQRQVVGIHNYGSSTGNTATRITPGVYQRLDGWRQL